MHIPTNLAERLYINEQNLNQRKCFLHFTAHACGVIEEVRPLGRTDCP